MGCIESTEEDGHKRRITLNSLIRRFQQKNKVVSFTDDKNEASLNTGRPMLSLTRKTEQMVMQQLWSEGIIPKRREGGVEFIIDIGDNNCRRNTNNPPASMIPGVPQFSSVKNSRPVVLPPISKVDRLIAIEEKMDRAKVNRDMKLQERKEKAAKTIATAQKRRENKKHNAI